MEFVLHTSAGQLHRLHGPRHRAQKGHAREAVCTVFEKVNTGGIVLDVFELLTATFAASE